jgi:eukaryotic-like serine/threonine-protein kinase
MGRCFRLAGALALATGMLAAPHFTSAQSAAGWPTFHGGPGRDGTASVNGPSSETELNRFSLAGSVQGSPVINGSGRVFIGDSTGTLYGFDTKANAAAPIWTYSIPGKNNAIVASPGLSPDGNTVYVASSNGAVAAVNAGSGAQVWAIQMPGPVQASPVASLDGSMVFLATVSGTIRAVSASNGATVWNLNLGTGSIIGSPTLGQNGTVLYVGMNTGVIYALPTTGGTGNANTPCYVDAAVEGSPAVDSNGNVYSTTANGTVYSFNPGCAGERWHLNVSGLTPSTSTPAIGGGLVVVGNTNGYVYGINASSGTQQWQFQTGAQVTSSAAIATGNNLIYTGSDNGRLYVLNASGQQVAANARLLGTGVGSPALAPDGTIWVASSDGTLVHIGPIGSPPGNPPTGTALPATATPSVTSTPLPTSTPTVVPLQITLKSQVAGGQRQTITIHSAPNTAVTLVVNYPNGNSHVGHITTDANGNAVHHYTQPASVITHSKFTANVTATAGSGSAQNTQKAQYKILFAPVDASAEPRTQKVGGTVQIYVHAKKGVHVRAVLKFPNGKSKTFNQKAGPKGFGHWRFKVTRGLTKGSNHTVQVIGSTVGQRTNYTTSTTFTIS